ncbi:DUF4831 family protein [Geofilum rubicundum]|uniref:DUF4831 domain-containing protein n=1 Tax=Geofilum rubicundum JCM 15548 TaxID=1236989 RepID=A0A0E9M331_9BACT|nr:DUF4831 family protein [Geofilum rubicundum]GAO31575.1 hypothetical protein JCM15548_13948 [Geofilum rubicundum JCM 15548]
MIYRGFIIMGLLVLAGCTANQSLSTGSVEPVGADAPTGHGLHYYLPKTAIQVEMIAEKRIQKVGPFYRFAQRFLNISDVITEDKEEWQIVGAKIHTVGVPDKAKLFRVNTSGAPSMAALNLTPEGVLKGLNWSGSTHSAEKTTPLMQEKVIEKDDVNFRDAPLTEEQLIKSSTAAMAEEVAKEIYHLREMRHAVISGEVTVGGSLEAALDEMARLEEAYLALFTGKVKTQRVSRFYDYVPGPEKSINTVLLRFSAQNGFLDHMDVSGTPVYLEVEVGEELPSEDFLALEDEKSPNRRGLAYNVPALARVKIIDRTLLLNSGEVYLAQYGQLLRLPANLLDAPNVGVELDPATGALKRIFYK